MTKALESPVIDVSSLTVEIAQVLKTEFPGPMRVLASDEGATTTPDDAPHPIAGPATVSGHAWRLRRVEVVCRADGAWALRVDGTIVKNGYTSAAESTISLPVEPWVDATDGQDVVLEFTQADGVPYPVTGRVYYTDND